MRAAVIALALAVAGCATLPTGTDGLTPASRAAALRAIDSWQMNGRLAVDTGERAFQARFRWLQSGDALTLTVRGPLGAGSFEVAGDGQELTVLSRGEQRVLTDPELELSAMFGWWLPVTSLPSWLLGLTDTRFPGAPVRDANGVTDGFDQRLWQIRYAEYQLADALLIPRKLSLAHTPLRLELTIDDWQRTHAEPTLN